MAALQGKRLNGENRKGKNQMKGFSKGLCHA